MVCSRNEPLVRSLFSAAFVLPSAKRAARRPQFFILGVDNEREEVSQDVLRELPAVEGAACRSAFLVSCKNKTPRARAYLDFSRVIVKPSWPP